MKRMLLILMLGMYLLATTECQQLLKLPVLVEHFLEHREQNAGISFLDFLKMHYNGKDVHDNDYDRDMQLPFKSHNGYYSLTVQIPASQNDDIEWYHFASLQKQSIPYEQDYMVSAYLSSIWQPPKFC